MRLLIAFLLCAFASLASALENNLPTISVEPEQPRAGQSFMLFIKGTWPDGCGANLKSVLEAPGGEITVTVERRDAICIQVLSNYTLPISVFSGGNTAQAGVYRVRYQMQQPGEPTPRLLAFRLIAVTAQNEKAMEVEPGYWVAEPGAKFATSGSGVGFSIERQEGSVVVVSNLYDASGKPTWYLSAGPMRGRVSRGDIYDVRGGQALFTAYRAPSSMVIAGELQVEFSSPARATLWYTQPSGPGVVDGLRLMPISITRFNFAYPGPSDTFNGRFVMYSEAADRAPRIYNFERLRFGASLIAGFRDPSNDHRLICTLALETPNALPTSCVLEAEGNPTISFDQVGYERMFGKDPGGARFTLERLLQ